jgi:hypothetical protein
VSGKDPGGSAVGSFSFPQHSRAFSEFLFLVSPSAFDCNTHDSVPCSFREVAAAVPSKNLSSTAV